MVLFILLALLASTPAQAAQPLRALARVAGIHVGTAVDVAVLNVDPGYARLLGREFDVVTPENAMKFSVVHPERDHYDFSRADALMDFAEAHDMLVHGHVLLWHEQLPAWLKEGHFSRDELKAILREHIQTLVTRYRGRISWWDVAAEAVDESGRVRETFWSRALGPDYLELAFRWAHEADPQARLLYNDYGGEGTGAKADGIYDLVAALRWKGVPIHGVGLQMHVSPQDAPSTEEVRLNMMRLAAIGLETQITEMDVMLASPVTPAALRAQAVVYGNMLSACLAVAQCSSFATWGVDDGHSWIPEFFPGHEAALLFDRELRPKPAYWRIRQVLRLASRKHHPALPDAGGQTGLPVYLKK